MYDWKMCVKKKQKQKNKQTQSPVTHQKTNLLCSSSSSSWKCGVHNSNRRTMTLNHFTCAVRGASLAPLVSSDLLSCQPPHPPPSTNGPPPTPTPSVHLPPPTTFTVKGSIDLRDTDLNNRSPNSHTVSGDNSSEWRSAASVNRNGTTGSHPLLSIFFPPRTESNARARARTDRMAQKA